MTAKAMKARYRRYRNMIEGMMNERVGWWSEVVCSPDGASALFPPQDVDAKNGAGVGRTEPERRERYEKHTDQTEGFALYIPTYSTCKVKERQWVSLGQPLARVTVCRA